MSLQSLIGRNSLVAAGIGVSDVVTLYTLGRRVGNWLTVGSGDQDFLTLLEEDEASILRRRGVIDIINFKKQWGRTLRLLKNGIPQRLEGQAVEKLLEDASRFTAMMTCIVATLDTFAAESTVRLIVKIFLQRLIPTAEINEDTIVSQLGTRINAWRSAAAVREMNTFCSGIWESLLQQKLIVSGHMPKDEAYEVANFLHWVAAGESEVLYTSSSDVAGIARCLTHLSFEILGVENYGAPPEHATPCRLMFSPAPFFAASSGGIEASSDPKLFRRELSTTVSLTQPEETFSTFPISRHVTNRCRVAWKEGMKSAKDIRLRLLSKQHGNMDLDYGLWSVDSASEEDIGRIDPKVIKLVDTALGLSKFRAARMLEGLTITFSRESEETLDDMTRWITWKKDEMLPMEANPATVEIFHVFQAFAMGFFYEVFLQIVDTTTLATKSVSGSWGYRSLAFLRMMGTNLTAGYNKTTDGSLIRFRRSSILKILALLFTNPEVSPTGSLLPEPPRTKQDLYVGVIRKRIILMNNVVKDCKTIHDIGGFTLLDTDAGSIPHNTEGLIIPGVPNKFPVWDPEMNDPPATTDEIQLCGPPQDFTRHIEPDWDGIPERVLLCIRYKGRRIGVLDPITADAEFCRAWTEPVADPSEASIGLVHECKWDDFLGRLPLPWVRQPNIPVVVHSLNSPCMRYAATAWYSESSHVAIINGCMHSAVEHAQGLRDEREPGFLPDPVLSLQSSRAYRPKQYVILIE